MTAVAHLGSRSPRAAGRVLWRATAAGLAVAALLSLSACGGHAKKKRPSTIGERISVLDYDAHVKAEPELSGVPVIIPGATVNASWTGPGGSPAKAMGNLALSASPQRLWSVSIGQGADSTRHLISAPVVMANRIFTIDTAGRVSAFDAGTGARLWQTAITMKGEDARPAFGGGVGVDGQRVYATAGFGVVRALDPATGAEIWSRDMDAPLRGAPTVADGRVYVSSLDSRLTVLSATDGETLWQVNATLEQATVMGPGSPAVDQGTVVAGFPSGELFALRVENGRTVWQDQLSRTGRSTALAALADIVASPVIAQGRVFAIGNGGRMIAIDLATGQRVWERDFSGVNMPWAVDDWVFVVTTDAELVALTRADGKIRWATYLGHYRNEGKKKSPIEWFGPVLAGSRLWLVSSDRALVSVDPATGEVVRREKLSAPAYMPPVVANGTLYVLTDNGQLTAYK